MDINHIGDLIKLLFLVHGGAMLVLAILSYFVSKWSLDGLESIDRWLSPSLPKKHHPLAREKAEREPSAKSAE